jgi:hypothetical protein
MTTSDEEYITYSEEESTYIFIPEIRMTQYNISEDAFMLLSTQSPY